MHGDLSLLSTIILGIVEGFTEFLPISSTAHLLITTRLLGIVETDFVKSFVIVIQLGAILAVVALYWRRFLRDWATNMRILAAFIPTAIIGFLAYHMLKSVLLEDFPVIGTTLLVGGLILATFERWHHETPEHTSDIAHLPYWKAVLIGVIQAVAIIPGVSRSGATIVGGMLLGVQRVAIVEFSFLLAAPTMLAASGYDLLKSSHAFSGNEWTLLIVGFVVSFIFAILGVRFFLNMIRHRSFVPFGVYRIVLGAIVLGTLLLAR